MLESSLFSSLTNPLFVARRKQSVWTTLARRYCRTYKCINSSAIMAILLSTFTVALILFELLLNADNQYFHSKVFKKGSYNSSIVFVILLDLIGIFYPIAGYLADNKFGRYRTVRFSLVFLLLPSALLGLTYVVLTFVLPAANISAEDQSYSPIIYWSLSSLLNVIVCIGIVGFFANIIQFGMDQIYEYPAEVQSLFIHWFWWANYAAELVTQLSWFMSQLPCSEVNSDLGTTYCLFSFVGSVLTAVIFFVLFCLLLLSSCLVSFKKTWFLIEPSSINPYKLVYRITKFAYKYRKPLQRSAFTFCEDEVPTGLDIGKEKYGGPFTMEQVEDVKAFYGIFFVLLSLGPVFSLHVGADGSLYQFAHHQSVLNHSVDFNNWNISSYNDEVTKMLLVNYGALTPLLMTVMIPLYVFLIRPLFINCIPGMLKRIGIGIVLNIISVACTCIEQVISHWHYDTGCVFDDSPVTISLNHNGTVFDQPLLDSNVLIIQRTLSALSIMFINIAAYEFICSQSPHSMKGLLIGLAYAIKGLFQTLSSALLVPFTLTSSSWCGEAWYFFNFGLGLAALVIYTFVAKKYKFRMRNDTCHIYKFAEDYYSKVQ